MTLSQSRKLLPRKLSPRKLLPGRFAVSVLGRAALCFFFASALTTCAGGRKLQKAVWVVRDEIASPDGPARIRSETAPLGFDALVVQVRGRGDAYYNSSVAPRAEALVCMPEAPPDFDPLAEILKIDGAPVIAWLNVYYLWGGDEPPKNPPPNSPPNAPTNSHNSPLHPATAHPDWLVRDVNGKSVADYTPVEKGLGWIEGLYADPASEGYRDHFVAVVRELVENYDVDGVHLDFVRYPGPAYGQAGPLGEFFENVWGVSPMLLNAEFGSPDFESWLLGEMPEAERILTTASLLWAELRASQITSLVGAVKGVMESVRPGLRLSAAVFPDAGAAYLEKGQDWRTWVSLGLMDELFPMTYFGGEERVSSQLESIAGLLSYQMEVKLWAGLGAFIKEPCVIADEVKTAASLGYDGICLFDLGGMRKNKNGLDAFARTMDRRTAFLRSSSFPSFADGRPQWGGRAAPEHREPQTKGGQQLAAIVERAMGGRVFASPNSDENTDENPGELMDARWREFAQRGISAMTRASKRIEEGKWPVPKWVDLKGIFRYVHPDDGDDKVAEQKKIIEEAWDKALAGEDFSSLAKQYSRGGTRNLGGGLRRRFLFPGEESNGDVGGEIDSVLDLMKVGEVSPIFRVFNGFWFYRIEAVGQSRQDAEVGEVPWPVRRGLFRSVLAQELPNELNAEAADSAIAKRNVEDERAVK